MKSGYVSKWLLFITSYLPLYLWLLLSNIDYRCFKYQSYLDLNIPNMFRWVLLTLITISVFEIRHLFIGSGSEKKALPKEMEVSPESDSLMNYIVTYFTPLVSFDLTDNKSLLMNTLLFFLIGLMYVGSSATYLNPVLGIFGFKIFGVSGFPNAHHIVSRLSFDEIETVKKRGDVIVRYKLSDGIYIINKSGD